jgi:hypothetical protein
MRAKKLISIAAGCAALLATMAFAAHFQKYSYKENAAAPWKSLRGPAHKNPDTPSGSAKALMATIAPIVQDQLDDVARRLNERSQLGQASANCLTSSRNPVLAPPSTPPGLGYRRGGADTPLL